VPELANYNGIVWYRANVRLSAAQAKLPATLSLGQVDEIDLTFVNGRAVGGGGCCPERNYALPAGLLKAGDNLVVVKDLDTYMSGGMYGPAEKRALVFGDGSRVALTGWEYQIAPAGIEALRAPWESTAGLSMIYNAMIAPLRDYSLRGAVWYQGESNAYPLEGRQYQQQLLALMNDWRRQFQARLPFLVVQLPNYGPMARAPVESAWAQLREAQRRAVDADGNAGLVVTIDIGNRDDVHPTSKQEVGRRLAHAARAVVFGEDIAPSGATARKATLDNALVEVRFKVPDSDLTVYSALDASGFELCGPGPGSCQFARAVVGPDYVRLYPRDGQQMLKASNPAPFTRVRYCWADSPLCNLYDLQGLPVGPFEMDITP
jgi:sialate O-acetylesterase